MSTEPDACAACTVKFDEIKSAIQCTVCDKFYHGSCEGINKLSGFHMKRATWKCSNCVVVDPISNKNAGNSGGIMQLDEVKGRKKKRSNQNTVVEVESSVILDLINKVEELTKITGHLNNKIESLSAQNQRLEFALSLSLQGKKPFRLSYAAVADTNKNKNNTVDGISQIGLSQDDLISQIPVNSAAGPSQVPVNTTTLVDPTVVSAVVKKKRPLRKPAVVGCKEEMLSTSSTKSSDNTVPKIGFAGTERFQWIYLGRVTPGATPKIIGDYVKSTWNLKDVKCFSLANNEHLCSFKIGVKESSYPLLLDGAKWPKGVLIREFVPLSRNRPEATSSLGNFNQKASAKESESTTTLPTDRSSPSPTAEEKKGESDFREEASRKEVS